MQRRDLGSVHRFAEALRSRLGTLDLLINNAGVASGSLQRTKDHLGLEQSSGIAKVVAQPPRAVTASLISGITPSRQRRSS